jgi:competence protein ComEA
VRADARSRGSREASAGFCVALLVFATTLGEATDPFAVPLRERTDPFAATQPGATDREAAGAHTRCAPPRESEAYDGRTLRVRCDGAGGAQPGPARVLNGPGIDPNEADAATLEVLPGIGPARAAAVIAGRADAPYTEARDLLRVRGIGRVTLRRAADWLVFPSPDTTRSAAGGAP